MKCGNCQKDHDTVEQVKSCYGVKEVDYSKGRTPFSTPNSVRVRHGDPRRLPWEKIQAGHYAVTGRDGRPLDFYRVDRPGEDSRWHGWVFLKMVVGGKPEVRISDRNRIWDVLEEIEKEPDKAAWMYGQEIGCCDRCNRHLTDIVSRANSRGPECRQKYGLNPYAAAA